MTFSIVQKSQLEGADRIDPEYYQPEYIRSKDVLFAHNLKYLSDLCKVTDGNHMSISNNFTNTGVRYLRGKDLQDFFISDSDPIFIPEGEYVKLKRSYIYQNDVLVSIVGTVGLVSVVPDKFEKITGSCKIAILHTKTIQPNFLAAFLTSKYGQFQLKRKTAGAVQMGIILQDLSNVLIPDFSESAQEKIALIVKSSYETGESSKNLYEQAESLLLEELGLKDFIVPNDLSYIVNYSDAEKVDRVDADYFQPKYDYLINKLGNKKRLSEFATKINPSIRIEPNKEYNYIEISDVNVGSGEVIFNRITGKELPANAKVKISGGELIISKVRPTRGAIAIIPGEFNQDFVASGAFSTFIINSPSREYLQVVLRSFIGKLQMERPTTGTSYPTITDEDVENILIPNLKIEIQQKISNLVKKSHEARKKSKELLEEAKRKVEEMIEANITK